ncbi:inositol monophosphatase family protein [Nocardia sp. NPDC005366]|uniref:inositol monophosphatase family protein n=1 Tax=Nocardia sp. NPDC005366 TaxID=3156878 RepID=UPI0033BD95DE
MAVDEVSEKAPNDLVTVADREAERLISLGLREILDVPVVGEESATDDPSLLAAVGTAEMCWLVDPIDGTANFAAGRPEYTVIVALICAGEPVAGWIFVPETGQIYVAEQGSGAFRDDTQIKRAPPAAEVARLRGAVPTRRLDPPGRAWLVEMTGRFADLGPGARCAGVNYTQMVDGILDFVLNQRSFPWDHAAGVVLLAEVGGVSLRPDGTRYRLAEKPHNRLLNAVTLNCWAAVQTTLWAR